jgi:glycosyltransferase involved in cell wall biosynthesis
LQFEITDMQSNMTPRILHLIPSLQRSGAEKQLCLLAAGLQQAGFDTHVCALAEGGPMVETLLAAGIRPTILNRRWQIDPRLFWNLKSLIDDLRPDVIHAWKCSANAYGLAAAVGCGVRRLVAGFRCIEPASSALWNSINREIGRRGHGLVANNRSVRDFYVEKGLPENKFQIIPSAVESPSPSSATRRQILDQLELPQESRLIGLIGRLVPHKRVKDAIWAADLLKVVRKDVHLLIFGDGPHRDRLRKFRDQVRIRDHVHFIGHRNDMPLFLPHLDLLWSTSANEGQSSAILEAMAAGVPVVASDIPGTRDLITHDQTGLLVHVGDRGGFAREAHRLLENPDLSRRLGQAGRERVQSDFTVEKMVEKYVSMYQQLL